jgi:hypothetical protein
MSARLVIRTLLVSCLLLQQPLLHGEPPSGDASIRVAAGGSEIVITTTSRLAGAIHSLTWNGREFIDSFDHGRQLQSALNLDAGSPIADETFNPTEAGSRDDGAGETSSSRLLHLRTGPGNLETVNQMAFWLAPGEKSEENLAKNETILSNHLLTKRVRIGYKNLPHVIDYQVVFTVPTGERHTQATFEALTGYMPPEFERFWQFNSEREELDPLSDGPGEIERPVVLATASGSHAMGIYSPPRAALGMTGPTYGRFRFKAEKVVKWNCVFRVRDPGGIAPGGYPFRMFVLVGDLETVRDSLQKLQQEFASQR